MNQVPEIINEMSAEELLRGSHILTQIEHLRDRLNQPTEGNHLSLDDYFFDLRHRVDKVGRIQLLERIAPQQESTYMIQLAEALDQLQDSITLLQNDALTFQGKLLEAHSAIAIQKGSFEAWFSLAVTDALKAKGIKLPPSSIRNLAMSEFERLMQGTPAMVTNLIEQVRGEVRRLELKKKMQREKYELGRHQVDAAYVNRLPPILGYSKEPGSLHLLKREEEEEAPTMVPYISNRERQPEPEPEPVAEPVTEVALLDEQVTTGFHKVGPPVEAHPIGDMAALEKFLKPDDAKETEFVPTTVARAAIPTIEDDELDALTSKPIQHAAAPPPPRRKPLVFDIPVERKPEPAAASSSCAPDPEEKKPIGGIQTKPFAYPDDVA